MRLGIFLIIIRQEYRFNQKRACMAHLWHKNKKVTQLLQEPKVQQGFTLLELLVAITIFSLISVALYSLFNQVLSTKSWSEERVQQFVALQKGLSLIRQDINQIIDRTILDEYGTQQPSIEGEYEALEFSRLGWALYPLFWQQETTLAQSNTMNSYKRSELQRVKYYFSDGKLMRRHWITMDRATNTQYKDTEILSAIDEFNVRFWYQNSSTSMQYSSYWPITQASNNTASIWPRLIEIEIKLPGIGSVTRLFPLIATVN